MKTGKLATGIVGASLLLLTGVATQSYAGVSVNVGLVAPPVYAVSAPPQVVVIPGTYVYAIPDADANILFYRGYWWRPYEGRWYRSARYNGSWGYVRSARIPRALINLPSDYHRHFSIGDRIAHDDLRRNWREWERNRHWDRHDGHQDRRDSNDSRDPSHRGDPGDRHGGRDR